MFQNSWNNIFAFRLFQVKPFCAFILHRRKRPKRRASFWESPGGYQGQTRSSLLWRTRSRPMPLNHGTSSIKGRHLNRGNIPQQVTHPRRKIAWNIATALTLPTLWHTYVHKKLYNICRSASYRTLYYRSAMSSLFRHFVPSFSPNKAVVYVSWIPGRSWTARLPRCADFTLCDVTSTSRSTTSEKNFCDQRCVTFIFFLQRGRIKTLNWYCNS